MCVCDILLFLLFYFAATKCTLRRLNYYILYSNYTRLMGTHHTVPHIVVFLVVVPFVQKIIK